MGFATPKGVDDAGRFLIRAHPCNPRFIRLLSGRAEVTRQPMDRRAGDRIIGGENREAGSRNRREMGDQG